MKKILLLSPFNLFPPASGGSMAIYLTLKYLSKVNNVHALITHLDSPKGERDLFHPNLEVRYCPRSLFDQLRAISILFNPYYFKVGYEIAKNRQFDVIQCEILWTAFAGIYLKKRFQLPLILVQHDVQFLKFKSFRKLIFLPYLVKKIEGIACNAADKIVALSQEDKTRLTDLYDIAPNKVKVISLYSDLDVYRYNDNGVRNIRKKYGLDKNGAIVTFIGNLRYTPNKLAVKNIREKIYPLVVDRHPATKFLIIGQTSEDILNKYDKYNKKNLFFTGHLGTEDLIDHLSASDVVIVPTDSVSGQRRKILEAAACARAIISTSNGAEGLDFVPGSEILVTENVDQEFVEGVIKLIEDEELRKVIGSNAYRKAKKKYNWRIMVEEFNKLYQEVTDKNESLIIKRTRRSQRYCTHKKRGQVPSPDAKEAL